MTAPEAIRHLEALRREVDQDLRKLLEIRAKERSFGTSWPGIQAKRDYLGAIDRSLDALIRDHQGGHT